MRTLAKWILALLSISSCFVWGADKKFQAGAPEQYAHQENDQVTLGAKAFVASEETKQVFGKKVDLNRYGVLPVLLVIKDGRKQALDLSSLRVKLVPGEGRSVVPLEPGDVAAIANPAKPPGVTPSRIPHSHKNPLDSLSIVERAFVARIVPAGDQASGFFYFQAQPKPGMKLLVQGVYERPSGKEIMYFEIPL